MNDIQPQVQQTIDELVELGAERGLQVAVYRNGELVVDAVAGTADPQTGRPVTSDTPFYNFSIGKGDGHGRARAGGARCLLVRHQGGRRQAVTVIARLHGRPVRPSGSYAEELILCTHAVDPSGSTLLS